MHPFPLPNGLSSALESVVTSVTTLKAKAHRPKFLTKQTPTMHIGNREKFVLANTSIGMIYAQRVYPRIQSLQGYPSLGGRSHPADSIQTINHLIPYPWMLLQAGFCAGHVSFTSDFFSGLTISDASIIRPGTATGDLYSLDLEERQIGQFFC
jgi:hypothetical protein